MRAAGAIDIGGTRTKLGVVAEDGRIVERATISTSARGDPEPLVETIVARLQPLLDAGSVSSVGVSVAGFLDREHEAMHANANLPLLCGFPLRRELGECAGDLGHIILDPYGRRCTCGAHGCLEALVCSAALSERAGGKPVRDVSRDANAGDQRAQSAIAETARWLGLGLASLAPLFAPDTIVVGGGVAAAGELLLEPVRASFRAHAGDDYRDVRIAGSSLAGWEGMIGAASLLLDPLD